MTVRRSWTISPRAPFHCALKSRAMNIGGAPPCCRSFFFIALNDTSRHLHIIMLNASFRIAELADCQRASWQQYIFAESPRLRRVIMAYIPRLSATFTAPPLLYDFSMLRATYRLISPRSRITFTSSLGRHRSMVTGFDAGR